MTQLVHNLLPRTSETVCAWCRDGLETTAFTCPGCGAGYHAECAGEASVCGLLGCAQSLLTEETARGHVTPAEPEPWWFAWGMVMLVTLVLPIVTYVAVQPRLEAGDVTGLWTGDVEAFLAILLSVAPFMLACVAGLNRAGGSGSATP